MAVLAILVFLLLLPLVIAGAFLISALFDGTISYVIRVAVALLGLVSIGKLAWRIARK